MILDIKASTYVLNVDSHVSHQKLLNTVIPSSRWDCIISTIDNDSISPIETYYRH